MFIAPSQHYHFAVPDTGMSLSVEDLHGLISGAPFHEVASRLFDSRGFCLISIPGQVLGALH